LALPIGADAVVTAATVDVETLGVVPVEHRYERLSPRRFRRTALDTAAISDIEVDEYGLAYDTPHAFRRL
jgi:hypothetical protein